MKISDIQIGVRHRKDLGDLTSMADSIKAEGLLQPVGVTPDNQLVFGLRRLTTCRDHLGWTEIDTRIVDVTSIIAGEYAENEMRKDFTVSERTAILDSIARKKVGDNQYGSQNFATLDEAAKLAGFGNRETARQAKVVVDQGEPELIKAMDDNVIAISAAAKLAKAPPEKQREIVEQKRKRKSKGVRTAPLKDKGDDARPSNGHGRETPQLDKARAIIRPLILAGEPCSSHALEKEHGISHALFDSAKAAERGRLQAFDEIGIGTNDAIRSAPFGFDKPERVVSLRTLIEKLDPLFDEAMAAVKFYDGSRASLLGTDELRLKVKTRAIADRGRQLLNEWASGDETVRLTPGLKKVRARKERALNFR